MNIFKKIYFYFLKPKTIVVFENENSFLFSLLDFFFKEKFKKENILLLKYKKDLDFEDLKFLLSFSSFSVFVLENQEISLIKKILDKIKNNFSFLIFNYDNHNKDEILKDFSESNLKVFTVGFEQNNNFWISDLKINDEINFKINYKGNTIPVWLNPSLRIKDFDYKKIISFAFLFGLGEIFDINLVEISQKLKEYLP